jgi:putative membrane protein
LTLLPVPRRAVVRGSTAAISAGVALPAVRRWSALVATGVVAWAAMAAAQIVIPLTDRRAGPTVVVVVAATVAAWAWAALAWGVPRTSAVLAWVVGSTLLIEWVGTTTGFPFGAYRYTDALQPQVAGVPLIVPLAWFAVGVPALEVAGRITGGRAGSGRVRSGLSGGRAGRHAGRANARFTSGGVRLEPMVGRWVVAALALTAWDLFLDPQMVGEGYWVWAGDGAYRDIPLTNYVGWFCSALVVLAVADRIVGGATVARSLPLLGLYTWWAVMETVGFLVFFGDPLVGVVGGVAMGVPTALAWRRLVPLRG